MITAADLVKDFQSPRGRLGRRGGPVRAVEGLNLEIMPGEVVGLVGPAGAGKSTVGRMLAGRLVPDAGVVSYNGSDLQRVGRRSRAAVGDELQVVLGGSDELPGRRSVREVLTSALASGATRGDGAGPQDPADLLAEVGLEASLAESAVGKLTGHQRALVEFARAVALRPALIVCDQRDTVSADERTRLLDLLLRLRDEAGTALVLLARDLADVGPLCDRVVVMYLGSVMEILDRDDLPAAALHPFTHALALAGAAGPSGSGSILKGELPTPAERPTGCVFRTRCFRAQGRCADEVPELTRPLGSTHPVACHFPERFGHVAQVRTSDLEAPAGLASPEPTGRDFAEG